MKKGIDQQKVLGKAGALSKPATKASGATAGSKSGVAGSGQPHPPSRKETNPSPKADGVKAVPQEPSPARRAFDGPELVEPTEAEVESEIQQLLNEKDDKVPPTELTLDLIIRAHTSDDPALSASRRTASEAYVRQLTHMRLDRQRLGSLAPEVLRQLPAATHLYLQHNRLTQIGAVAALPGLRFLALRHNRIETVDGLSGLTQLVFLDLSYNRIAKLDERALPPSLTFVKLEGNPCATGHVQRYCLRRALRACCPRLRHMDRDLDEEGEEISEEEEEEDSSEEGEEDLEGGGTGRTANGEARGDPVGGSSASGTREEGGGGGGGQAAAAAAASTTEGDVMLDGALDMLDALERATFRGAAARAGALVRESVSRSMDLRNSMQLSSTASGSRPGTASTPPRPRSSASHLPPPTAPTSPPLPTLSRANSGSRRLSSDGLPRPTSSSSTTSPSAAAAANPATAPFLALSRPDSATASPAARPLSSGPGPRLGTQAAPLPPPPPLMSRDGRLRRSGGASGAAPGAAVPGGGPGAVTASSAVEQQVAADLDMLTSRVQALMEPESSATLTQDAPIYDARQAILTQVDRMKGAASDRICAQREAAAAVSDAIRRLRTSSTLQVLRANINLGPGRAGANAVAAAAARAATAAAEGLVLNGPPARPASAGTAGGVGSRPGSSSGSSAHTTTMPAAGGESAAGAPRPRSSASNSGGLLAGGVPLPLGSLTGSVATLPHSVLRESLSRLEGMLIVGSNTGPTPPPPRAAAAAAGAGAGEGAGGASVGGGGGVEERGVGGVAEGEAGNRAAARTSSGRPSGTPPGSRGGEDRRGGARGGGGGRGVAAVGGKAVTAGAGMSSRPSSGASGSGRPGNGKVGRPLSASGKPAGAVVAAAKAAAAAAGGKGGVPVVVEVEAEILAGDEAGTEGLYSEDEEPEESVGPVADFGFMFKTSLPPNPFVGGK